MANNYSSHVTVLAQIYAGMSLRKDQFVVAGYGVEALKVEQRQEVQVVRRGLVMIDER